MEAGRQPRDGTERDAERHEPEYHECRSRLEADADAERVHRAELVAFPYLNVGVATGALAGDDGTAPPLRGVARKKET
ncbi:hypothetical protein GCM10009037_01430 [Halarchaeum grantii]|uniref:Uncharacterized protein n=1 Tax=Halarchaeum grantii TaxID=1193105 RepID=A0A830F536_9EURY|nr:hypothetical protein GCM10009037_01430 [Halarchaeum grantii]